MAFQRKKAAAIGAKAPFPGFVEPALATSTDKVPSGERWIDEIKFDGYRVQLHIHNDAIKVLTRRGKDVVWFAINDDRPLTCFAGIWTEFKGDRGTKSKPIPGPHQVYGFLATSPNAVVEPIHPKAMPVGGVSDRISAKAGKQIARDVTNCRSVKGATG